MKRQPANAPLSRATNWSSDRWFENWCFLFHFHHHDGLVWTFLPSSMRPQSFLDYAYISSKPFQEHFFKLFFSSLSLRHWEIKGCWFFVFSRWFSFRCSLSSWILHGIEIDPSTSLIGLKVYAFLKSFWLIFVIYRTRGLAIDLFPTWIFPISLFVDGWSEKVTLDSSLSNNQSWKEAYE